MERYFKKPIIQRKGYTSPPQKEFKAKLNQNESPFDVPDDLKEYCLKSAAKLEWNRYPINESPQLRRRLAERHAVQPEWFVLGNGSNQLFQTLLTASISPGDSVLLIPPTFSLYELFLGLYEAETINVMHGPGQPFPLDDVLSKIAETQPRLVILCSPNNPTGFEMNIEAVKQICEKAPGIVFFDEAYGEFAEQSAVSLLPEYENLLVSRTFSKAFSMAGLRFGYIVGQPNMVGQLQKANLPYNVNIFTELVALQLLEHEHRLIDNIKFLQTERDRIFNEMKKLNDFTVYPSGANFLLFHGSENIKLFQALKDRGILVRDMSGYPLLKGFQRVSVGFRHENDFFLQALRDIQKLHS